MNKYRKYVVFMCIPLIVFCLFHISIWFLLTKHILLTDEKIYNGDVGRFTYKLDSIYPRPSYLEDQIVGLDKLHITYNKLNQKKVDMITIGDSFSGGATQGINPFYQDYIATNNNFEVLNILPIDQKFYKTVILLMKSGLLDELKPKAILLESIERFAIDRFSKKLDISQTITTKELENILNKQKLEYLGKDKNIKIINSLNRKALKNNLKFIFNKYGKFNNVYITPLNKDFYTSKDENSLLFYYEDIENIVKTNKNTVKKLNENLNKLAEVLKKKNIKLYFMPVVDKYNLYSKYIVNNPYPKSQFFELLRELPKEYELIDTKKILREELEKGVKDLYYSDDTHWSYKASEAIVKKVRFE